MIFLTKSILALILTGLATANLVVMLELLGRTEEGGPIQRSYVKSIE